MFPLLQKFIPDLIELLGAGAVIGFLWYISGKLASLHTIVAGIKDNDLPHLQQEVEALRGEFISHLERHDDAT